jgi:molecular chaperone GrpE (heat shock protein)
MKVNLIYELPEEIDAYKSAMNGYKFQNVLQTMDNHLRAEIKYNNTLNEEDCHLLQTLRDKLHEFLSDEGVTLYE